LGNAVAESFFTIRKKERIKRRIYATRDEAKSDVCPVRSTIQLAIEQQLVTFQNDFEFALSNCR
jgi:hypothetical protein